MPERDGRLLAALETLRDHPVVIDRAGAADWVREQLSGSRSGDVLTVVWHSITRQYWPAAEYASMVEVIDEARSRIDDLEYAQQVTVMLGAVCHDLGKPPTTAVVDGRIRSLEHEEQGVAPATALLDRLNIHSMHGYDVRRQVLGIVANHLKPGMFAKADPPVGDGAYRRLAQKVDLELLARVAKSDCEGRGGGFDCSAMDQFLARARRLGVEHAPPEPLVKGRHLLALGVKPGPAVGEVLKQVYERQLDGSATDFESAMALAREIARERQLY
jgi:tRNA nucleotidyltransferase (CCA-adding enzyme)